MLPVAKPLLGEAEVQAASRAVLSGWVTQGPEVAAFEREFAAYVGAAHACAVSSCTVALHLALKALGVGPGDEVITASHSFIATANSIRYCDATPVFVDIEPRTFNLDPSLIEAAITARTRAILCVHQIGMPCDLAAILEIGRRRRIAVVEDAACAIGSEIRWHGEWQKIGRPHGDIACFSFHPRKLVTTGDGGMLTTSNPEWDAKFRLWRQHGMTVPDTVRHRSSAVTFESYSEVGYNYRMTDIQAAIGREQLKRLPQMLEGRRRLVEGYRRRLGSIPGLVLPEEAGDVRTNWQSYCVRLPEHVDQRDAMQAMLDAGISTRRGVMCSHREPAYAHTPWRGSGPLRHSEEAQDRCIILPLYAQMTDADLDRVAGALQDAIRTSAREARVSRATD